MPEWWSLHHPEGWERGTQGLEAGSLELCPTPVLMEALWFPGEWGGRKDDVHQSLGFGILGR